MGKAAALDRAAVSDWQEDVPIYRQVYDRLITMILDGVLSPGDAVPSVRQVAVDYRINPLTVSKAYQSLSDEGLVEKRRGMGMYVLDGARERLLERERERFLHDEWPLLLERIARLEIGPAQLLEMLTNSQGNTTWKP